MQLSVRHFLRCDANTVFGELYLEQDYARRLHLELFGSDALEGFEQHELPDGVVRRLLRVRYAPNVPLPLRRVLDRRMRLVEDGLLDARVRTWSFEVRPEGLEDVLAVQGLVRVEPAFGGCERVLELEVTASVYGMGSLLERHVAREARRSAELAAALADRSLRERGLLV